MTTTTPSARAVLRSLANAIIRYRLRTTPQPEPATTAEAFAPVNDQLKLADAVLRSPDDDDRKHVAPNPN